MEKIELKPGDILLHKGNSLFDRLISIVTRSKYSHSSICLEGGYANTIAEALATGFVIHSYGYELNDKINSNQVDVYRYPGLSDLGTNQLGKILQYCESQQGTPYGWIDLSKILLNKLCNKQVFKSDATQLICSEAVVRAYLAADINLFPDKSPDLVTPADLGDTDKLTKII